MEEIGEGAGLRGEEAFKWQRTCVHVCKLGGEYTRILLEE